MCTVFSLLSFFQEVQSLKEENTRLKTQLVKQGKELLGGPAPSLAAELQDAPRADVSASHLICTVLTIGVVPFTFTCTCTCTCTCSVHYTTFICTCSVHYMYMGIN